MMMKQMNAGADPKSEQLPSGVILQSASARLRPARASDKQSPSTRVKAPKVQIVLRK